MHIATLASSHNRRECTLAALEGLHAQRLPQGVSMEHVLVDDASIDGTVEAVRSRFPDVEILEGTGNLFWAGAMRFGWNTSVSRKAFDYLFVYNDDVRLATDAIACLLETAASRSRPHAVVGSFLNSDETTTTYGGRRRSSKWHPLKFADIVEPNGSPQKADTLNMNGALISRSALDAAGFLSDYFVHSGADYEFGLKLIKAGGEVVVAGRHIGHCEFNTSSEQPPQNAAKFRDAVRALFDQKREPFRQRFQYYRRHGGWFWPLLWVSPYLTILPRYMRNRLSRKKSTAHTR